MWDSDWLAKFITTNVYNCRLKQHDPSILLTYMNEFYVLPDNVLLSHPGVESAGSTNPSVYLRDDPIRGLQIENQSELRAPTADHATYYLDAAVAARTVPGKYFIEKK